MPCFYIDETDQFELSCLGQYFFSYSLLPFNAFTGPPKALDEDETEFLDAVEMVSGDLGTTNLSWGFLACSDLYLVSLDRRISRYYTSESVK